MRFKLKLVPLLALAAFAQPVLAGTTEPPAPAGGVLSLLPQPQTTNHSITIAGRKLDYQAKAGTLSLLSGRGDVTAEIFYVAYTLPPPANAAKEPHRPITFVFNGGPGAASAYLHLGALGPRIIATGADGEFLPSPQKLIDNPDSWLDMSDLVFVDPVGTGYSREAPGQDTHDFWGVNQDASSIGAFIRLYLAQNGRTASPLFLAGESYGGFRAALLARTLQEDVGISPSGIVLISPALEFMLVQPDEFEPLHWALELPSLAAVRLRSEGVSGDALREKLAEVEHYAMGDYLTALAGGLEQGGRLASQRVSDITGLPLDLVQRNFARIPTSLFAREFARAKGKVLSPYDATIGTADIAPESARIAGPDPVLDRSVPALTSAFVGYISDELNFHTDISYRLLNGDVTHNWDYGTSRQGYAGVMDDLQRARSLNPALGVVIVNGYTDLVTPYLASRYLVNQVPPLADARPIRVDVVEGGHMMYFRPDGRRALKEAAAELYQATQ
ncbi:MAG: peptidase S10 [Mesorhizobium sp.]|uniref:S10 family peptidase n=1 Tax=unclassified Mesorhizobium TaxID=325217 RepID=UPI000F764055|nr:MULTISPECIES: peptidase S10 [unclassified Mesorhizobium]RVD69907.1 peptidase S10 [Mesorhizobium sp. M4A.F.Ca.ET.029.04.2.1]AZO48203.1 peptidase S10 [Mesorhizobium sp. M4B.F.Ca.ET.058.02.1.1]RVC40623.1 peptidase S10 [Mesorhizobium sp. M4A.F.Ca.ET.090.04.2.1]RVC74083.1 peptidase S10 [Mesorhizobium sp. M4A.F.Ca.ET.022.05.2.1]RWC37623.1 MAG: peptidase S10 [Mesorhizobium sp.]